MNLRLIGASTAVLAVMATAACGGGGTDNASSGSGSAKTLTYWASNQGPSLDKDKEVLTPVLAKFTQQTGIKVNLEVIGWPDLLNRILAAITSTARVPTCSTSATPGRPRCRRPGRSCPTTPRP